MMSRSMCVFLCLLTICFTFVHAEPPKDCLTNLDECSSKTNGYYPDCVFCDRYIACIGTAGHYMMCPAQLVYKAGNCVYPTTPCVRAADIPETPPPNNEEKYCYSEIGKEVDCLYDIGENAVVTLKEDLGSSTSPYISCTKNVNWLTPIRPGTTRKRLAVRGGCCGIFNIMRY